IHRVVSFPLFLLSSLHSPLSFLPIMDGPVDMELHRQFTSETRKLQPTETEQFLFIFSTFLPLVIAILVSIVLIGAAFLALFRFVAAGSDRKVYNDQTMMQLEAYANFTSTSKRKAKSTRTASPRD
ncbi:hypothetical protein PFISCL1PPCAC_19063, partial [Pristionchus fissidentatus]